MKLVKLLISMFFFLPIFVVLVMLAVPLLLAMSKAGLKAETVDYSTKAGLAIRGVFSRFINGNS